MGFTDQDMSYTQPSLSAFTDPSLADAFAYPTELDDFDFDQQLSDAELSDEHSDSEEGEVSSDTLDKPEQTEDMNYRETVRSIHSFRGGTTYQILKVT